MADETTTFTSSRTVSLPSWQSWVFTGLITLLVAVGSYAFNAIDKRMSVTESRMTNVEFTVNGRGERIATLETQEKALEAELAKINANINLLIRMHLSPGEAKQMAKEALK